VQLNSEELFADQALVGTVFCRAYARRVDEWLQELFESRIGSRPDISLVAVGGYGQSTLSPQSDLDVMLLHDGWSQTALEEVAELLWYPVWDEGLDLGHSVRTVKQSLELASTDLETATSLLSLRHLAGDADLSDELVERSSRQWRKHSRTWLPQIVQAAADREREAGEVAFLLEPDLKYASGGLRDVNAVEWIEAAGIELLAQERRDLRQAREVLLAARVELHRSTGRKGDRLLLEEQDAVAAALGVADADVLMSNVSAAARTITWIADDVFLRVHNRLRKLRFRRSGRPKSVATGVELVNGGVRTSHSADIAGDEALLLRLAVAAAEHQARIDRDSLDLLVDHGPAISTPWIPEVHDLFIRLLRTGHHAIPVVETLDHVGLFVRLMPEWEPTRSKVQRNQYHRFTVDRHLLEASANAAELVDHVARPDLLVVGALLHDIGKGYPGDHTEVGVELIDHMASYMGFDADDVDSLKRLCEHHLLLPDIATRRDIEDPATVAHVAEQVRTPEFLRLLGALTESDSIATGPSAWSSWKAHLIGELSHSVERLLNDGDLDRDRAFPSDEQRAALREQDHVVHGEGDTLTVITRDRVGLFARVAGALALRNLSILGAQTFVEHGKALEVIRVVDPADENAPIDWHAAVALVEDVLAGDDDLAERFAAREASALFRPTVSPSPIVPIKVEFDNDLSADSTIVEVGGPDRLGLLYELSSTLANAGLDTRQTLVQTVGGDVVDSFYVQTLAGTKLTDPAEQESLRRKLLAILQPVDAS